MQGWAGNSKSATQAAEEQAANRACVPITMHPTAASTACSKKAQLDRPAPSPAGPTRVHKLIGVEVQQPGEALPPGEQQRQGEAVA